jgi:RNase P protein component
MRHVVAKSVKNSIRRVQYERILREIYSACSRSMHYDFKIDVRAGGKFTVDSYEGTFHAVGLNRVCAYLSADWEACKMNKKWN